MNPSKIFVTIIMLSLVLTVIAVPEGNGQDVIREAKNVHINMKADSVFSPEYESGNDTEPQKKRVFADYDDYGAVLMNQRYVDVGTWTSDGMEGDMTVSGNILFNIWFIEVSNNGGSANDPDWIFELQYNGDAVAQVEIMDTASSDTQVIEITAQTNLAEPLSVGPGDTLGVYIQYKGWEDIDVYYDNIDYDSGALISMDSLVIFNADKSSVRFYDAWGLNWDINGKYFCFIDYGGTINMGDLDTVVEDGGSVEGDNGTSFQTVRINFNNIDKGTGGDVSVTVNYGPNGTSEGWYMDAGSGGGGDDGNGDGGDDISTSTIAGAGAFVIVLIGVLAYLFVFKNKAKGEEEEDEEYEEGYEGSEDESDESDESDEYGDDEEEE